MARSTFSAHKIALSKSARDVDLLRQGPLRHGGRGGKPSARRGITHTRAVALGDGADFRADLRQTTTSTASRRRCIARRRRGDPSVPSYVRSGSPTVSAADASMDRTSVKSRTRTVTFLPFMSSCATLSLSSVALPKKSVLTLYHQHGAHGVVEGCSCCSRAPLRI